ncbi:MAG TPA: Rieske 2Fe-2S domain-containing protein [Bosea sp. (in: a-proteobacteria)]|nr:Rieske 2Fe-2S domain-containing protein [Bosea sp. (in: a-proteobacteria)]
MPAKLPLPDVLPAAMRALLNAARVDPDAFVAERKALETCWTFLGFEHQVAGEDDWFRSELGGRSIVVQRFSQGIAAFENKCAHRGYPLRQDDSGNGPLLCGFHHWRYNHEGLALGIPNCVDMFGKTPREIDARLKPVELAQAGGLIFGRFADRGGPSLEEWLGPAFPILRHVFSVMPKQTGRTSFDVKTHWRYIHEISLDDYHIVAIHPSTFGAHGYLPGEETRYEQIGPHSMFFRAGDENSLQDMVAQCEDGAFFPPRYRILQVFPGLVVSFTPATRLFGEGYWYVVVLHIIPVAHDRSKLVTYSFRAAQPETTQRWRRIARRLAWPVIDPIFAFYARRVMREDNAACELLQAHAAADDPPPRLAAHEERIGWFEEAYALAVSGVRKGAFRWPGASVVSPRAPPPASEVSGAPEAPPANRVMSANLAPDAAPPPP